MLWPASLVPLATVVLIVEDDPPTRDLYRHALRVGGFDVVTANDGLEALELIDHGKLPDAIVLDLGLPRLRGQDFYAELRSHADTKRIPVVVVTGMDLSPKERADFPFFLSKPVVPEVLIFAVDNALRRFRR